MPHGAGLPDSVHVLREQMTTEPGHFDAALVLYKVTTTSPAQAYIYKGLGFGEYICHLLGIYSSAFSPNFVTTTGTVGSVGATAITSVASTTGIVKGDEVYWNIFPAGTKVTSISGSTVNVDTPSTGTGTGATVSFGLTSWGIGQNNQAGTVPAHAGAFITEEDFSVTRFTAAGFLGTWSAAAVETPAQGGLVRTNTGTVGHPDGAGMTWDSSKAPGSPAGTKVMVNVATAVSGGIFAVKIDGSATAPAGCKIPTVGTYTGVTFTGNNPATGAPWASTDMVLDTFAQLPTNYGSLFTLAVGLANTTHTVTLVSTSFANTSSTGTTCAVGGFGFGATTMLLSSPAPGPAAATPDLFGANNASYPTISGTVATVGTWSNISGATGGAVAGKALQNNVNNLTTGTVTYTPASGSADIGALIRQSTLGGIWRIAVNQGSGLSFDSTGLTLLGPITTIGALAAAGSWGNWWNNNTALSAACSFTSGGSTLTALSGTPFAQSIGRMVKIPGGGAGSANLFAVITAIGGGGATATINGTFGASSGSQIVVAPAESWASTDMAFDSYASGTVVYQWLVVQKASTMFSQIQVRSEFAMNVAQTASTTDASNFVSCFTPGPVFAFNNPAGGWYYPIPANVSDVSVTTGAILGGRRGVENDFIIDVPPTAQYVGVNHGFEERTGETFTVKSGGSTVATGTIGAGGAISGLTVGTYYHGDTVTCVGTSKLHHPVFDAAAPNAPQLVGTLTKTWNVTALGTEIDVAGTFDSGLTGGNAATCQGWPEPALSVESSVLTEISQTAVAPYAAGTTAHSFPSYGQVIDMRAFLPGGRFAARQEVLDVATTVGGATWPDGSPEYNFWKNLTTAPTADLKAYMTRIVESAGYNVPIVAGSSFSQKTLQQWQVFPSASAVLNSVR